MRGKNLVNAFFIGTVVYIALRPEIINLPPRKLSVLNNLHFRWFTFTFVTRLQVAKGEMKMIKIFSFKFLGFLFH
jgi:hypothetical protein